jgi:hypothetical protein
MRPADKLITLAAALQDIRYAQFKISRERQGLTRCRIWFLMFPSLMGPPYHSYKLTFVDDFGNKKYETFLLVKN